MEIVVTPHALEIFHPTLPLFLQVARTATGRLVAWVVPEGHGSIWRVWVGVA